MRSPETPENSEAPRLRHPQHERALADEELRRFEAEARASDLADQARQARTELSLHLSGVRYRLGHALILALKPSIHTLALPFRLAELLLDGLGRWRARRRARARPRDQGRAGSSASAVDPEIKRSLALAVSPGIPEQPFAPLPLAWVRRPQIRVAAITDEFSWRCWQYEADFHPVTPRSWRAVFEAKRPDLFLVESAWSGPEGGWQERLTHLERRRTLWMCPVINEILAWCRRRGVPTVFLNKEDPTHFEPFLDLARSCDLVMTSDSDCVEAYRTNLGHSRIGVMPFAAQPRLHNPIMDSLERTRSVCFAGTWYAAHHSQRQRDAEALLLPALDFGLDIFSRLDDSAPLEYRWPDPYRSAIRGTLPYSQMVSAYKLYRAALNLNSIAYSPTMVSRRMFELLACGTPVVSSHARSISELIGDDVVLVTRDAATTRRHLEHLLHDEEERQRRSLRGIRAVFARHTYGHRFRSVLDALHMNDPVTLDPSVAWLAPLENAADAEHAHANFARQLYPEHRLVLCARRAASTSGDAGRAHQPRVETVVVDGSWGAVFQTALSRCKEPWIALMAPRDYYGPNYLVDFVHATQYSEAAVFAKSEYHEVAGGRVIRTGKGSTHRRAVAAAPWSLFVSRERLLALAESAAASAARSADEWAAIVSESVSERFSIDCFNYVRHPNGAPSIFDPLVSHPAPAPLRAAIA